MAAFRSLLEALGYDEVQTLLNSGNAVFASAAGSTARHAAAIREAMASTIRVDVPVIVKSAREFRAIEAGNALATTDVDPSRLLVAFTSDAASLRPLAALKSLVKPPERFLLGSHAAYLLCPEGILQSAAATALLGKMGRQATTRNWRTVLKLGALLKSGAK